MGEPLEDRQIREVHPLIPPNQMKRQQPAPSSVAAHVLQQRSRVRDVLHGRDPDRLVVVVGPCSLHDRDGALAYADRLAQLAARCEESLVVIMRTYFEKPRTTVGWKGLINDPRLDGSCDIPSGLALARDLLLEINQRGLGCGTEFLDPVTPQFLGDLISWAAIGARTTESQTHREMASGLSMPVGFKNGTDGTLDAAANALVSAANPHAFLGISDDGATSVVHTTGNPDRHLVLRGGSGGPNHDGATLARASDITRDAHAARGVMVDCSHENSGKQPALQGSVLHGVLQYMESGAPGAAGIMGFMLESHLEAGRQDWSPERALRFGVSITDACIAWDETESLLLECAAKVRSRSLSAA